MGLACFGAIKITLAKFCLDRLYGAIHIGSTPLGFVSRYEVFDEVVEVCR